MIYDNVKRRAEELKKSIAGIEAEAGIANGTIAGWRSGSRPYADTLYKVACVLGCTIEELLKEG